MTLSAADLVLYSCSRCRIDVVEQETGQVREGFVATQCGHLLCSRCGASSGGELEVCPAEICGTAHVAVHALSLDGNDPILEAYFKPISIHLEEAMGAANLQNALLADQTQWLKRRCLQQMEKLRSLRLELAHAQQQQQLINDLQRENAQLRARLGQRISPPGFAPRPHPEIGHNARPFLHSSGRKRAEMMTGSTATLAGPRDLPQRTMTPARLTLPPQTMSGHESAASRPASSRSKERLAQFAYDPARRHGRQRAEDDLLAMPPPTALHTSSRRSEPSAPLQQYYGSRKHTSMSATVPASARSARQPPSTSQRMPFRPAGAPLPLTGSSNSHTGGFRSSKGFA